MLDCSEGKHRRRCFGRLNESAIDSFYDMLAMIDLLTVYIDEQAVFKPPMFSTRDPVIHSSIVTEILRVADEFLLPTANCLIC